MGRQPIFSWANWQRYQDMHTTGLEENTEAANQIELTDIEFDEIVAVLDRTPNPLELHIFSLMWSELGSYKIVAKWLKTLPNSGNVFGENEYDTRGLVEFGNGTACVIDISKVEMEAPEAACRKILVKGARPIAMLNSYCFDNKSPETSLKEVIVAEKKNAQIENSAGIQAFQSEVIFDENIGGEHLTVAMMVGKMKLNNSTSEKKAEHGSAVFMIINGVNETAQSGGKREDGGNLIEAILEVNEKGLIHGVNEIEKGNLIRSICELSIPFEMGVDVHLDKLSTQPNKERFEDILSGSKGAMLIIAQSGKEQLLVEVFEKWNLACVDVGSLTEGGHIKCYAEGEVVVNIPSDKLINGPSFSEQRMKVTKSVGTKRRRSFNLKKLPVPNDLVAAAKKLFLSPSLIARSSLHKGNPRGDAAIVELEGTGKSLLMALSCNAASMHADPYYGASIAVSETARKIICTGGIPLATATYLNFGNPENSEGTAQFTDSIKGIGDTCRKFGVPVVDSEVNFLTQIELENAAKSPLHAPIIGMIGTFENPNHLTTMYLKNEGDLIYMIGNSFNDLGSSEFLRVVHEVTQSSLPCFDIHEECEVHGHIQRLIRKGLVISAHSVSIGGLFANLMESAILGDKGFQIELVNTFRRDCFLFGESQGRVVISISQSDEDVLQNYLITNNVSFTKLGEVLGDDAVINDENFGSISSWKTTIDNNLSDILEQ